MSNPMYIVTGATGHIGNNVVRYLLSQNVNVRVLIRRSDESLEGLTIDKKISSSFDHDFLNAHINEHDIIIHCAAYIDLMNRDLMQTFRTNVQLTKRLIDVAKSKHCRFIYLSSVDVIPKQKRGLVKEPLVIDKTKNKSYYKTSKAVATNEVLRAIQHGLNGMVLYPSAVVGIHDYKPSAAGREILHAMHHKILFSLHGGYNFIDVEDVSKSVYQASISSHNDHLIISGHDVTIRALYEKIEKITKSSKWIIPLPIFLVRLAILFSKKYSQMMISTIQENYHYDNSQMISLLHIHPTPLDETLGKTINWLKQHHKK
jgi:dihydroflavonol-4-reductase